MLRSLADRVRSWFAEKVPPDRALVRLLVERSPPSPRDGVYTPEQERLLAAVRSHEDIEAALPGAFGVLRADLFALHGDLHWKEQKPAAALEYWQVASDMIPTDLSLLANLAEAHAALGDITKLVEIAENWRQLGGSPGPEAADARAFERLVAEVRALAPPDPVRPEKAAPKKGRTTLR